VYRVSSKDEPNTVTVHNEYAELTMEATNGLEHRMRHALW